MSNIVIGLTAGTTSQLEINHQLSGVGSETFRSSTVQSDDLKLLPVRPKGFEPLTF
jgi:hypothetical protein